MLKLRKRIPVFYTVLMTLILLAALITGIVLNILWDFLYNYEANLPKYQAEKLYNEYFLSGNYDKLYDLGVVELGAFEGKRQFEDHMRYLIEGKDLQHYEMVTGHAEQKRFRVCTSERKIGDIYLKPSGEVGSWNQTIWEFDRIELAPFETQSVKVKAVHGGQLYLNGVRVGEEYLVEQGIQTPSCNYMPEGVAGITYDVYSISGLISVPEVSCVSPYGLDALTYYDKESAMYVEDLAYDTGFAEAYGSFATDALQTYQRYLTNDATRSDVKKYLDAGSDFYKALMNTDTQWYAAHIGHEYEEESVTEFYRYSDQVFSCHYVGTQVITRTKKDVRYFNIDCILYFHLVDGEYRVYNIVFQ